MGEIVRFDQPYWKGFCLLDGKQRWLYTEEKTAVRLKNKEYFNKNTLGIVIYKGYETEENDTVPFSDMNFYICIDSKNAASSGNNGRLHYKSKRYVVIGEKIYQQFPFGCAKEIKKVTKELKGALAELRA